MASWLDRLFGADDSALTIPSVKHPSLFGDKNVPHMSAGPFPNHPEARIGAVGPQGTGTVLNSRHPEATIGASGPTPTPNPNGGGKLSVGSPAIFKDPGISPIPDPSSPEAGFMQGFTTDEEGDLEGLHGQESPYTFDIDEVVGPVKLNNVDLPESPFAKMSAQSAIQDVDPESGFVPGQDGVADAIHRAMQGLKKKQVGPTGPFAGNDQTSMMPATDIAQNLPADSQVSPDLEPLISGDSGGWGDNSAPMLQGIGQVSSQVPSIHKQNLFKALLNRLH